jgi:poly [ADP-ribose] polymerase
VANTIEVAPSGRAQCRGCGEKIAKDELRLGARLPNPFVEGELTLWFHLACGAYKRPEAYLEAAKDRTHEIPGAERLEAEAKRSLEHHRLPRLSRAERAKTGRATCRSCREAIAKDTFRISLVFFDEEQGRFEPGGFVHAKCAAAYFETRELVDRIRRLSPGLEEKDLDEIRSALDAP